MTTATAPGRFRRLTTWLRVSPLAYLGSLVVTVMSAGWANYLSPLVYPEGFTIKGQALVIVIPLVSFPLTLLLWWLYRGTRTTNPWLIAFIAGLAASWLVHMVLGRVHGDQYAHLVWLFVPILAMLLLKTPSTEDAWHVLLLLAWIAVVILISTRLLEILGVVPMFRIEEDIIEWEKTRYWLPFSGYLGVEGRWPGPFGFNSKTGFVSTLLVLIGLARWRRSSIVLVVVGAFGILLTGGRGAALALAAGLFVLVVFAARGPVSRIPMRVRAGLGVLAVVGFGLFFFLSPTATTGRLGQGGIWEVFTDLWRTSPWIGVGQTGILADPQAGIPMEAHSLYLQELTRSGVLGFVVQFAVIGLGVGIAAVAAYRGLAWPLALLAAYYVASLTEVFQDGWLQHSTYSLLILLCVIAAGQSLSSRAQRDESSRPAEVVSEPGTRV